MALVIEGKLMNGRLGQLDMTLRLGDKQALADLRTAQKRLVHLRLALAGLLDDSHTRGLPLCVMFEGWDASGKGGAIKRLVEPLDPRHVRVATFGAPTDEEYRHHFLWRFWRVLPGWGEMTVLDRSWYGRVLIERVEGLCSEAEWERAYGQIVEFEKALTAEGMILVKVWLHVTADEQLRRFQDRAADPLRRWKLNAEDWLNREKRTDYETAIEEMLRRTDHPAAPWTLIEGNDKGWARVKVIQSVIAAIETRMAERGLEISQYPR